MFVVCIHSVACLINVFGTEHGHTYAGVVDITNVQLTDCSKEIASEKDMDAELDKIVNAIPYNGDLKQEIRCVLSIATVSQRLFYFFLKLTFRFYDFIIIQQQWIAAGAGEDQYIA